MRRMLPIIFIIVLCTFLKDGIAQCTGSNVIEDGSFEAFDYQNGYVPFTTGLNGDVPPNGPQDPITNPITGDGHQECVIPTNGFFGLARGAYSVGTTAFNCNTNGMTSPFSSLPDNTIGDGTGQFMIIDFPENDRRDLWCQTVIVEAGIEYRFEAFFRNILTDNSGPSPIFNFKISDALIPTAPPVATFTSAPVTSNTTWEQNFFDYTTPGTIGDPPVVLDLCLENENFGGIGFDLSIDDISFKPISNSTAPDILDITQTANTSNATPSGCGPMTIDYTGGGATAGTGGFDFGSFDVLGLNPLDGTVTNNNDGSFTFTPGSGFSGNTSFQYEVCNNAGCCDQAIATLTYTPSDVLASLSGSACTGTDGSLTINLSGTATSPFDVTYTDGTNNFTLNNITDGEIININPSGTELFQLLSVADNNGCAGTIDDTPIQPLPSPTIGNFAGNATEINCGTNNIQLSGNVSDTGAGGNSCTDLDGSGSATCSWVLKLNGTQTQSGNGTQVNQGLSNASLIPGEYCWEFYNDAGCADTACTTIADALDLNIQISINTDLCTNTSTNAVLQGVATSSNTNNIQPQNGGNQGWRRLSGTGTISNTQASNPNFTAQVDGPGQYELCIQQQNGFCEACDTIEVLDACACVVDAAIGTPDGLNIDCTTPNREVTLDNTGSSTGAAYSYEWSQGSATTTSIEANAQQVYTLTVRNTVDICESTASVSITLDTTPPAASLSGNGDLTCTNTNRTLTAGTGDEYNFGTGFSATNTLSITNENIYTVTVRDNSNSCTATSTAQVMFDTITPKVLTVDTAYACENYVLEINGMTFDETEGLTGVTYRFLDNTGAPLPDQNDYIATTTTFISLEGTALNGCRDTADIIITILPLPQVTMTADNDRCGPGDVNILFSGGPPGGSIRFNDGSTDIDITLDINGEATYPYSLSSNGTIGIELIEIDDGTCISNNCP